MKLLAIEHETSGVEHAAFDALLRAEAARLWELWLAGVVREAYFRAEDHTAVLILEAASPDEARETLATLPLVRKGLVSFEVSALVAYDGFARLFAAAEPADQQVW